MSSLKLIISILNKFITNKYLQYTISILKKMSRKDLSTKCEQKYILQIVRDYYWFFILFFVSIYLLFPLLSIPRYDSHLSEYVL